MSKTPFIVLEGTDGSGKSTQFKMLTDALTKAGVDFTQLKFPVYGTDGCILVEKYLHGDFGTSPDSVNPYAASTFFAMDRYVSFKEQWGKDMDKPIFSDRYTTSNAVHQASKLPQDQIIPFCDWLFDYEYNLLGLPAPTCVIFLDMPTDISISMLEARQGEGGDIHELDHEYLKRCHDSAITVCEQYGWHRISCAENGKPRPVEDIHRDILRIVTAELAGVPKEVLFCE